MEEGSEQVTTKIPEWCDEATLSLVSSYSLWQPWIQAQTRQEA